MSKKERLFTSEFVTPDDIKILKNILWSTPENKNTTLYSCLHRILGSDIGLVIQWTKKDDKPSRSYFKPANAEKMNQLSKACLEIYSLIGNDQPVPKHKFADTLLKTVNALDLNDSNGVWMIEALIECLKELKIPIADYQPPAIQR